MRKDKKKKEIERRLDLIVNKKAAFGMQDQCRTFGWCEPSLAYYPSEFIRIIDREKGIIEFREIGINVIFMKCVLDLVIEESEVRK